MKKSNNPKKISTYFKEEIGVVILVVFFGITFNGLQVVGPIMLGKLITALSNNEPYQNIINLALIYLATIFIVQTLRFFKRYFVRVFANKTLRRMRFIIYNKVIRSSIQDLEHESFGNLMSRCVQDVDLTVEGFRKALTEVFDTGVLMIAYFVTLMVYDYRITLISSILIPLSMLIAYLLKGNIYKATKDYRKYSSKVDSDVYELISHSLDYRNYDSLDSEINKFDKELDTLKVKAIKSNLLEGSMQPIYSAIGSIGVIIIIIMGGINVKNGASYGFNIIWDVGVFCAYLKLFLSFIRKSAKAAKLINTVQKAKISFKRIEPYLDYVIEDEEVEKIEKIEHLEVKDLSFGYVENNPIIGPISFNANKGEIIAICGKIASGKSTLGVALLGLYPYKGSIKLNEHELSSLNEKERSQVISYSGHNPYLLSNSIKNNVLLGEQYDPKDVFDDTCLSYDLEKMKEKENTYIGNNGIKLSGGQKQRVSLARALLKKNDIIILDDPFASLDMVTEKNIIESIKNNYHDSIVIIITQRLSLLKDVDKVIYLDDEPLFDTHENMLLKSTNYKKMYIAQVGDNND